MRINEAIRELWKLNFFSEEKTTAEVVKELRCRFGITGSNISTQLKSCKKFLRKNSRGWIQKIKYDLHPENSNRETHPFNYLDLAPEISSVSKKLFDDGHYAQAVFEAYKKVNNMVKNKAKIHDDGKSLMLKCFNESNPLLRLNKLKTLSDRNEQEGYKFMFAGAMIGIRNPKAHETIIQNDPNIALQLLSFANLLIRQVKKSKKCRVNRRNIH